VHLRAFGIDLIDAFAYLGTMLKPQKMTGDMIVVTTKRVACDGGGGVLGHPKIWLDMGIDNSVRCKYCDRIFALDPNAAQDNH